MHPGLFDPFGARRSIGSAPAARSIAFAPIAGGIGSAARAGSNRFSGRRYSVVGSR
jgi:hypothetical protein